MKFAGFFSGAVFFFRPLNSSEWVTCKLLEFCPVFFGFSKEKKTKKTDFGQKVSFFTGFDLFLEVDRLSGV